MKILAFLLAAAISAPGYGLGPDRYDPDIRSAADRWLPGSDWLRYRALLWQESRLTPDAVSPAGAEGIAQFMPGTWRDVAAALGLGAMTPRHARPSIEAGAYYLAKQIAVWSEPRPYLEQRRLGEASYNAGPGNIIRAQRLCRQGTGPCNGQPPGCRDWNEIGPHLPAITGHHARETLDYVRHIERWWALMR